MDAFLGIGIAIVLLVIALAAWLFVRGRKSSQLRGRFGPEYDRLVHEQGSRRRAEAELESRARRVERFHIRPLSPEDRARFAEDWRLEQTRFVDDPGGAVAEADRLVEQVMRERGYPMGEFDDRAADISVDHPHVVENYRAAHAIAGRYRRGEASTEDLRKAMVHYRALFEDLLEEKTFRAGGR